MLGSSILVLWLGVCCSTKWCVATAFLAPFVVEEQVPSFAPFVQNLTTLASPLI